jgi:hypothetical protein
MEVSIVQKQDAVSAPPWDYVLQYQTNFCHQPREFKYPTGPQLVSDSRGAAQTSGQKGQ